MERMTHERHGWNRRGIFLGAALWAACTSVAACSSGSDGTLPGDTSDTTCGPLSCPGCCYNSICQGGTQPSACGFGGVTCRACSPGQVCDNGACLDEGGCDLESCPSGCCQADTCMPGTRNEACGTQGYECEACSTGFHCAAGDCVADACDARSCSEGCCESTTCRNDHGDAACGWRGAACARCMGDQHCVNSGTGFACTSTAIATYSVTLAGAVVDSTKPDAERHEWDGMYETSCVDTLGCGLAGCCPPDVYVEEGGSISGLSIPKIVISNSTSPTWNLLLGNAPLTTLSGGSVNVQLMDEDESVLADDEIGTCTGTIREADVTAGRLTLSRPGSCSGAVQSITFNFSEL